jgi:hypothetical protein
VYSDGQEALATVHEAKPSPDGGAPYLDAGEPLTVLNRQHAFINQTLANHALAFLSCLFRFGRLQYHGGFVSLASGAAVPLRIDPKVWARIRARNRSRRAIVR